MTFVAIARWKAKPGEEEHVAEALRRLTEPSRSELGCVAYQPLHSIEDPTLFMIYEEYDDRAAFDAHRGSPHFAEHALGYGIPHLEERIVTFCEKL